jgi:hypothetical protein
MEVPGEVIAAVLTVLAGGGGFAARRYRNGHSPSRHAAAVEGGERRQGQQELIQAVREGTRATREESAKTQSGITDLAKEQTAASRELAELTGYLRAKL